MNSFEIIFTDGAPQIFSILELWTQLFDILTLTIIEIALILLPTFVNMFLVINGVWNEHFLKFKVSWFFYLNSNNLVFTHK